MKIEVEIDDDIYYKVKEMFGDADLGQVLGGMLRAVLIIRATNPEDFEAVFSLQASPEQRERIDGALNQQAAKVFEKAKHKQ